MAFPRGRVPAIASATTVLLLALAPSALAQVSTGASVASSGTKQAPCSPA